MKIVHITPGSGEDFYCENCLRDNAAVKALVRLGHDAVMVPLYLPIPSDAENPPPGASPVFFGGINVYLQQKFSMFRKTPRWLDRLFDSPVLLKWASKKAGMTAPEDLGDTTLSILLGEEGRQKKELDRLADFLAGRQRPEIIVISNALLIGMARTLKQTLNVPIACLLQDEDTFIDKFPESLRAQCWDTVKARCGDVDAFIAVSRYYAGTMQDRLGIPPDRMHVVNPGIDHEEYSPAATHPTPPAVGFLSRQCADKGLDTLVDAFIALKKKPSLSDVRLRIAGGALVPDEPFVDTQRRKLARAGVLDDTDFVNANSRQEKVAFLQSLSVLSVPESHGEAFGLYIIEAAGTGVPAVLPRNGAAPEILEKTGAGLLFTPNDPEDLARTLEPLLLNPRSTREMGLSGYEAVKTHFTAARTAEKLVEIYRRTVRAAG